MPVTNVIIRKGYRFKLKTDQALEAAFVRQAGCTRFVWNKALKLNLCRLDAGLPLLWYADLCGLIKLWRKSEERGFVAEAHSQVLQQKLKDLDRAFKDAFDAEQHKRLPVFKKRGLFDVLSHPDLVKIFGHRPATDLGDVLEETVAGVARAGVCLEVSSAGLRKPVGEIYPSHEILALAARYDVPITLASDAHHPRDVGHAFPRLIEYVQAAGYSRVAVFERRRRLEPLHNAG